MIENLKPYPKMKASGVPWLGEFPDHWQCRKLRSLLANRAQRNQPLMPLLSVVRELGVIERHTIGEDENHNYIPDDLSNYKVVRKGDFAINKMKAWQGSYGISFLEGIVSPAYFVLALRSGIDPRFFHRAIRSQTYVPFFARASDGVRIGQWDLDPETMREIPFIVPPRSEQERIVRFLDHADGEIDRYIKAKQKLIKLLEEQKQAVIHQAVTRGLNPTVRLKPSGMDWLGEIPEHWTVRRLGQLGRIFNGSTPSRNEPSYWRDGTIPWLASGKVNERIVTVPSELISMNALRQCSLKLVPRASVLVGLVGQGKTRAMAAILAIDACINQNLAAIIPGREIVGKYLHYFLTGFYEVFRNYGRGGNQEALNCEVVSSWNVALPPIGEQEEIVDHLNDSLARQTSTEQRIKSEIELITELKNRLVDDLVTGKLEVRTVPLSQAEGVSPIVGQNLASRAEAGPPDQGRDSARQGHEPQSTPLRPT